LRSLFDVTGTTLRRALPDLDARIAAGDLAPVFDWLRTNVWSQLRPRGGTPTNWRAGPAARYARPGAAHLESRYLADASR
jgi:carboxypeptidase Taq